jgi:Fe-S cluster biogenesis protein NfuA
MELLEKVITDKVRPILLSHGGDIQLLDISADKIVKVRLTGACSACPGAQHTLSAIVETALKEACPTIQAVEPVFQVSEDLIQDALKILRKDK